MKNIKRAAAWLLCAAMLFSTQELQILATASPSQVVLEDPEDLVRDASSSNVAAAERMRRLPRRAKHQTRRQSSSPSLSSPRSGRSHPIFIGIREMT